jgi:hypothetical protein
MPLVIVAVALALIVGLIRPRAAFGVILTVILMLLAAPFVDLLLQMLPWWLLLLLLLWVGLYLFRSVIELMIGERAAAEAVGSLAADVIRFGFRLLFLPFRVLRWILRRA